MPKLIIVNSDGRMPWVNIAAALLLLALSACTSLETRNYNDWVRDGMARAERGEITWSKYYSECFTRLEDGAVCVEGKYADLEFYNTMIGVSREYESGKITQQQFEEKRREAQIARAREKETRLETRRQAGGGQFHLQTAY